MKAIIFDMDGVLVNTEPLHYRCWKAVFAEQGIDLEYEIYKPCIGSTLGFLLGLVEKSYGRTFEDPKVLSRRMGEIKAEIIAQEGYPRLPGVEEAIHTFYEAGYRLAVASSSAQKQIETVLKELHIGQYFSCAFSGERVAHPKPAPDTFLAAAKLLHVRPEECLVIEDSTNGGRAAHAAGMKCVWYHNPDSGEQNIETAELVVEAWEEEVVERIQKLLQER